MSSIFDSAVFTERLFFPRRARSSPPRGARDDRIEVEPGVRLHLRTYVSTGARALVLFFHGNGETVPAYDRAAPFFAGAGASLAVVDYRGYGESDGAPTLRTCIADAIPVANAVRAATSLPVVAMGRSLGSVCAVELARATPPFAGIILESGIGDLAALARRHGVACTNELPDDLAVFDPLRKLPSCTAPLLVLHGSRDALIPSAEGQAAFDAAGTTDKRLVFIPEADHNTIPMFHEYWEAIGDFIDHVAPPLP